MKVFISWSGERSKLLANALRDWLPLVLQYVEPWVSDKDIAAGDRWAQAIAGELESSNFGIICVTPENLNSEWILFEAGALSKSMLDAKVIPLLFGLELSDLSGPLSQFQAQKVNDAGIREVIRSINDVSEKKTQDTILDQTVPALWSKLKEKIDSIGVTKPSTKHDRPQREILEEIVSSVRGLRSEFRENNALVPLNLEKPDVAGRQYSWRPQEVAAMVDKIVESKHPKMSILFVSEIFRKYLPWVSEIVLEYYHSAQACSDQKLPILLKEMQEKVEILFDRDLIKKSFVGNKKAYLLMRETLDLIDYAISRTLIGEVSG